MQFHTIIIGAGQAGLTAGFFLRRNVRPLLILEASREIGSSWKNRYDSLVMITPSKYNALPKFNFPISESQHPEKDDMASYLKHYAGFTNLPVHLNQNVKMLKKQNGDFWIESEINTYVAKNVIIATGAHQHPYVPDISKKAGEEIFQLHSATYKNPFQLPKGKVLIVGSGNSASDIAMDLLPSHEVSLSVLEKLRFRNMYTLGRSWLWWREVTGLMFIPSNTWLGNYYKKKREPIYGKRLKKQIDNGTVRVYPAVKDFNGRNITFKDGFVDKFDSIIWATGFTTDFSWINIPQLFDLQGNPKHKKGVSNVPGLYFLGLDWQRTRSSSLIAGVTRDARFIARKILQNGR